MPTFPVKFFHSDMEGAPVVDNTWGRITNLLDKVLIQGFGTRTPATIIRSGSTVTVTFAATHAYSQHQIIRIEGCDQTEYNTDHRVTSVSPYAFTFEISGTPVTPATGTITVKIPGIEGWEIYKDGTGTSNTSRRAYRSTNVLSNKPILWIDDGLDPAYTTTYAKKAKVAICEDMFDIDNPKGAYAPFSTTIPKAGMYGTGSGGTAYDGWYKWYYAKNQGNSQSDSSGDAGVGNRRWCIIGDDRTFYFFVTHYANYGGAGHAYYKFGDFYSYKANDKYNSILNASEMYVTATSTVAYYPDYNCYSSRTLDYTGKVLMRDYYQYGNPVNAAYATINPANAQVLSGSSTGNSWPNEANFGLILAPTFVFVAGSTASFRGKMPGEYFILNNMTSTNYLNDLTVVDNVTEYSGKKFLIHGCNNNTSTWNLNHMAFDITGPWW